MLRSLFSQGRKSPLLHTCLREPQLTNASSLPLLRHTIIIQYLSKKSSKTAGAIFALAIFVFFPIL